MKKVLISINPKWCYKIAREGKTVEVRKTKPNIKEPFKCYIYATQPQKNYDMALCVDEGNIGFVCKINYETAKRYNIEILSGKVIGEFICDRVTKIYAYNKGYGVEVNHPYSDTFTKDTCLTLEQLDHYLNGKDGYGWHISNLVIYDKPRELDGFIIPSKIGCCNEGKCRECKYFDMGNGFNVEDDCNAKFSTDEFKPLRRPPQSWCYVEEVER